MKIRRNLPGGVSMRRKSLRSSAPWHNRKATPRRSERVRDPEYMAKVAQLPCYARALSECAGRVEVDHMGRRPLGRKCSDTETGALCSLHHRQRTDWSGPFRAFTREQMRAFLDECIAWTQAELGREKAEVVW